MGSQQIYQKKKIVSKLFEPFTGNCYLLNKGKIREVNYMDYEHEEKASCLYTVTSKITISHKPL